MSPHRGTGDAPDAPSVLVVGGGLAGLATAVCLSHYGARVTVVDREDEPWSTSRYHRLDVRTMEILRSLTLEAAVFATGGHPDRMGDMVQVDTAAGPEISRRPAPPEPDTTRLSPLGPHRCQDVRLRAVLRRRAADVGVDIRYGTEVVGLHFGREGVAAATRGQHGAGTIRAAYVVGADGPESMVRASAGIPVAGPGIVGQRLFVHFRADLSGALGSRRFAAMQIDRVGATLLCEVEDEPASLDWSLVLPLADGAPSPGPDDLARPDYVALLRAAVGDDRLAVEITAVVRSPLILRSARRFGDGQVLLVGDAASAVPLGPGLSGSSIIGDAQNLAWKLAAALRGAAGAGLLDTYDAERRPLAELRAPDGPPTVARPHAGGVPPDRLTFELGARYSSAAVLADDASPAGAAPFVDPRSPGGHPGVRAPHVEIVLAGARRSIIDLYGLSFVLILGPGAPGWEGAAVGAAARSGTALAVYRVGGDLHDPTGRFEAAYGLSATGAVLVRPDGIVGWRSREAPAAPGGDLEGILGRLLGWDGATVGAGRGGPS